MTQPQQPPGRPDASELLEDWRLGAPGEWLPTLYVVRSRGGMVGAGLPPIDLTGRVGVSWFDLYSEICLRSDPSGGPVMVRFCRANHAPQGRYSSWSADIELVGQTAAASAPSRPSAPLSMQEQIAAAVAAAMAQMSDGRDGRLSSDPLVAARQIVRDAEERMDKTLRMVLDTIKEERRESMARSAPEAPDRDTAYKLGSLTAELQAMRANPPGARSLAEVALESPTVLAIGEKLFASVDRFLSLQEKKVRVDETKSDARLLLLAKQAGVEVAEQPPEGARAPDDVDVSGVTHG